MAKIKHLIFDMGNVLMRYDPEVPLKKFVKTEKARNLIRRELFQGPEWVEADRGMISEEEMYESVARRIPEKYHEELKKCVYEWIICMKPLEKSVKLCEDARKWGYQTYVFPMPHRVFMSISRNFTGWKILMVWWYPQMYT